MLPAMVRFALVTALLAILGGCDSKAKASDPSGRGDQKSKEYESCSASTQCVDELRCFDHACRRVTRSTVGDYYAAVGWRALANRDTEGAIDAYNRALGHYDTEKIPLPPDIDCAYGTALAAGRAKKEHAELGARVLHRCLLALPASGGLRDHALADLASLADAGLDPLALGRTQLADVYLTRQAAAPSDAGITVTASPAVTGKSYQAVPDKFAEADVKAALQACFTAYTAASHKDTLVTAIGVKVAYIASEYEDEAGSFAIKIDPAPALPAGAEATADQCVRAVAEPAIKGLTTLRDAFTTKLTITIK